MRASFIIIVCLALSGCGSAPTRTDTAEEPDGLAQDLYNRGDYGQSANEYLSLANEFPDRYWYYQLEAANAFIMELEFDRANAILNDPALARSGEEYVFRRAILQAKIALFQSRPDRALELLDLDVPDAAGVELLIEYYETGAQAHELQGDYLTAARQRVRLGQFLEDTERMSMNTARIWNYFLAANMEDLLGLLNSGIRDMKPWVELAGISKTYLSDRDSLVKAIQSWREAYPRHPANQQITSQILSISERFNRQPAQIALLLPLTGVYERYSERIRDGFLSAWFTENSYKPLVRIYNTDARNIEEMYHSAVEDGAEFIVGPLEKDAVKALSGMDTLPVRILALNQVDTTGLDQPVPGEFSVLPELVQFGLPPEDEARQVAQRGIREGFRRALVITSADEYGDRVVNAFSREWAGLGGIILERVNYAPTTSDFVSPVKQLLNIDSSEDRISALRQRLGRNISDTSRLRQDGDFIFMVASNLTARQIVPHLKFFRAGSLPIYTISYVYTGRPNPQIDSDLNGVEFVDMPWIIDPDGGETSLQRQIRQSWQSASTTFPRYYAFGIDAFRMIFRIADLSLNLSYVYRGETGGLYMSGDGIVHRELVWARFVNGVPEPVDTERNFERTR